MIELIEYTDDMFDFILESNNINKPQVGFLSESRLQLLIDQASYCKVAKFKGELAGFLLCLPENRDYDSPNYQWVSKRFKNFMYIDRISVFPKFQNEKIGSALYTDLIYFSAMKEYDNILCEVNIKPPNPGSIRFHKRFDFEDCGSQFTEAGQLESYKYSVEVQFL
jgi:predicted GNAT superfamily acetyltransferase